MIRSEWGYGYQCTRNASKDGYCGQHHPDAVKARQEASNKKWEEESRLRREARNAPYVQIENLTAQRDILLEALKEVYKSLDEYEKSFHVRINPPTLENILQALKQVEGASCRLEDLK